MLWYHILIGLICIIAAFWLGGIDGRRVKRVARQELCTNSLNMLKSKSRFIENESRNINIERKETLLQATLLQLKESTAAAEKSNEKAVRSDMHVKKLQQDLITFSKQQNSTHALWKQKAQNSHNLAVQSHVKAMEATALARKTALHLKQLEDIALGTQRAGRAARNLYDERKNGALGRLFPSRSSVNGLRDAIDYCTAEFGSWH